MATELDINEDSYGVITATITSDGTTPIPSADIDSIEVTLIETQLGTIINSRQKQDATTGDFSIHATSGLFTWNVQPEDTEIVGNTLINKREVHLATFTVTWDTTKTMHFEIQLNVLNLRSVPQVSA